MNCKCVSLCSCFVGSRVGGRFILYLLGGICESFLSILCVFGLWGGGYVFFGIGMNKERTRMNIPVEWVVENAQN